MAESKVVAQAIPVSSARSGDPEVGDFEREVQAVAVLLRSTLTAVVGALPSGARGGSELARQLGLGTTLGWQLFTFVESRSPVEGLAQLPGRQAFDRVIDAAKKKSVSASLIRRLDLAYQEFEDFVERHAGDRTTLASMVAGLGAGASEQVNLDAKRDAFRAMGHVYGVQRDVALSCCIVGLGSQPGKMTYVSVEGSVGLRLMKRRESVCLSRRGYTIDEPGHQRVSLAPVAASAEAFGGVPVLPEFCSHPLPEFSRVADRDGFTEFYIRGQRVGKTGEVTYFLGESLPNVMTEGDGLRLGETTMFPTSTLLHDLLVPTGMYPRINPETRVYGNAISPLREKRRDIDLLSVQEQAVFIGTGIESVETPLIPQYLQMLSYVCRQTGFAPAAFDVYRCRIEYPVLHSLVSVNFPDQRQPPGGTA